MKPIQCLLLTVFLLIVSTARLKADYVWTSLCRQAYEAAIALDFDKAHRLLSAEKAERPENLIPVYIESQIDFLKSFIDEDKKVLEGIKIRNEQRISIIRSHKGKSPYQRLCIAEMYLQLAIARARAEEFFGAAYDVRKAYKLLEENQKDYPEFKPNLRGIGLIHAAVGTIPKNYQWVAGMLGLSGSIKQGLNELKLLLYATTRQTEYAYLKDETIVMLTFLELNLGKDKDNESIRKRFYPVKNIQEKPLLLFAKSVFHFAAAENDSVIKLLSSRSKDINGQALHYLNFMEANARLYNMDFSAELLYLKYLQNYRGNTYVKSAWQKVAWIHLLKGDDEGYRQNIARCVSAKKGEDLTDEDKAAIREAENKETPNVILLRARLLFDGGYYQRSLNELAGRSLTLFPTVKAQLEYTYRLARIFDKMEKKDKALQLYENTHKNGASHPYYFAASSALYIGQLYEDQGNKVKATEWYKKTLEMRDHEYQNSIDQKAKAGLNRLGD
ncbi:MAG: hypothetical protein JNL88_11835 [Bacteroidia bacterium]|nr:hypothetical protein [Bacteroidia bacterium]